MGFLGFRAAGALSSALLIASCAPPFGAVGKQEITVVLPTAPAAWGCLPELEFTLSWRGCDGQPCSLRCAPGSSQRIGLARGRPQAILASPESSGRALLPAGALYPEALSGAHAADGIDELKLDWKGGYAASLARALEGGDIDPWGYDLGGLAAEALVRSGDPWLVPVLEVARRLEARDFRIDGFKKPKRMKVGLPGPGPWAPESPFEDAPILVVGGCSAGLSEGFWHFLGPESELFAAVDAAGGAATVRR